MKAWTIVGKSNNTDYHKYNLENFKLGELPIPVPEEDEVLVETKCASINPVDYKLMCEMIPVFGEYPWIPGVDGAGIVKSVGSKVTKFKVGDRVCCHCNMLNKYNTFAQFWKNKEHVLCRIPDGVSFQEACGVLCAGMTSYQAMIQRMKVEKDKSIFIYSGSGGCGSFAIQFAKIVGMKPIITSASPKNFDLCKELGADIVIDYKKDVHEEVKKLTNGIGVKYVYNTYSTESSTKDFEILAHYGHLATLIGFPDISKWDVFKKGFSFHEICLGSVYANGTVEDQKELCLMGEQILKWCEEKKCKSLIAKEFKFGEFKEAVECLMHRKCPPGKVVVNFD